MTQYIIPSRGKYGTRTPVMLNGKLTYLPADTAFTPEDGVLEVLDRAGVEYEAVLENPVATEQIIITGRNRIPYGVNGTIAYMTAGEAFTPTAEQLEVLDKAGIAYEYVYEEEEVIANLVSNGDFADGDTDWTVGDPTSFTFAAGVCTWDDRSNEVGPADIVQNLTVPTDGQYRVVLDVTTSSGGAITAQLAGSNSIGLAGGTGTKTGNAVSLSAGSRELRITFPSARLLVIDNVIVEPV